MNIATVKTISAHALIILLGVLVTGMASAVPNRATATGVVNDAAGKPVSNATVLVYSAAVRTGYNVFCPTCYLDCGKRALTDASGRFTINDLDDELTFDLLVVKDGFAPRWIRRVDPLKGEVPATAINAQPPSDDPRRLVRGKVTDRTGDAIPNALIEAIGAAYLENGQRMQMFGRFSSDDSPLAVTNAAGEFELVYSRPALNVTLHVSARAMAPVALNAETGLDRKAIILSDGATIRGRLIKDRKPLAGVEFGLGTLDRSNGAMYPEVRVSTDEKGVFAFTNVPPRRVWNLYAKMESLAGRGAMLPVQLATERDGQVVDAGDIRLQDSVTLSGRVELTDGKPIPQQMWLGIDSAGWDYQQIALSPDGTFVARSLLPGRGYVLRTGLPGYHIKEGDFLEVLLRRDVNNYVVRLEPDTPHN